MALYGGVEIPGRPCPENVRRLDILPLPALRRMMLTGFAIDADYFRDLSHDFGNQLREKRKNIAACVPPEKLEQFMQLSGGYDDDVDESDFDINPDSGKQLSVLLFDVLGIGRGKKLKTTKGGDRLATDKKQLEMLKKDNPIVSEILEYRQIAKLKGTYTDKLPRIARLHRRGRDCALCGLDHLDDTLRVHTQLLTTRTATGRFASKSPNLQNISARTPDGRKVRAGFVASPGKVLVQRDFSQIELRLGAHVSNETNMIRIFQQGLDIHVDTAMRAFNKTEAEVTSAEGKLLYRAPCKNVNFAIFYLISDMGLLDLMAVTYATAGVPIPKWMTQEWCAAFMKTWFDLYPDVKQYMDHEQHCAHRYGCNWTLFGRVRRCPEVRSVHRKIQAAGERQAGNIKIQGTGADLMRLAMASAYERTEQLRSCGYDVQPLLTIHDELIFEAEEDVAEAVEVILADEMDNVMTDKRSGRSLCRVPIESAGHCMKVWKKD